MPAASSTSIVTPAVPEAVNCNPPQVQPESGGQAASGPDPSSGLIGPNQPSDSMRVRPGLFDQLTLNGVKSAMEPGPEMLQVGRPDAVKLALQVLVVPAVLRTVSVQLVLVVAVKLLEPDGAPRSGISGQVVSWS